MSKENPNSKSKKLEKALFVAGVAAGALMGARGLIVQKSNEVLLGFKSKWSLQRLPASGEAAVDEC